MQIIHSSQHTLALLSLCLLHRDGVRIGVYFLRENTEAFAGASGTQMFSQAVNDILLPKRRRENFPETKKLE